MLTIATGHEETLDVLSHELERIEIQPGAERIGRDATIVGACKQGCLRRGRAVKRGEVGRPETDGAVANLELGVESGARSGSCAPPTELRRVGPPLNLLVAQVLGRGL